MDSSLEKLMIKPTLALTGPKDYFFGWLGQISVVKKLTLKVTSASTGVKVCKAELGNFL